MLAWMRQTICGLRDRHQLMRDSTADEDGRVIGQWRCPRCSKTWRRDSLIDGVKPPRPRFTGVADRSHSARVIPIQTRQRSN